MWQKNIDELTIYESFRNLISYQFKGFLLGKSIIFHRLHRISDITVYDYNNWI